MAAANSLWGGTAASLLPLERQLPFLIFIVNALAGPEEDCLHTGRSPGTSPYPGSLHVEAGYEHGYGCFRDAMLDPPR